MKIEYKGIKFDLVEYRDSNCHILRNIDPIVEKLDEDVSRVNSICSSPYIKSLQAEVNAWR
jgi:dynein heavy chain